MTDNLSSFEIPLGRWFGTQVRAHAWFVLFVPLTLLGAALSTGHRVVETAAWLLLLGLVVALHELGHLIAANGLGTEPEEARLWPLGDLALPAPIPASRWAETAWTALAGPLTNFVLALVTYFGLLLAHAHMVLNPFGNDGSGAPILAATGQPAAAFTPVWWAGWFGYLNLVVLLANLIPALPMDCGRFLRALMTNPAMGHSRDSTLAPYTALVSVFLLGATAMVRLVFFHGHLGGTITLICLALLIYWLYRLEIRLLEEGGYFEEGIFGYDFSEGYTSLEGSAQKVRPYQESALRRWHRRRSELRRQRRQAREAAEEQRMDEILAKLHSQGRAALSNEENRFLIRVSTRLRNRPKTRG